jgi:hypothetical protein
MDESIPGRQSPTDAPDAFFRIWTWSRFIVEGFDKTPGGEQFANQINQARCGREIRRGRCTRTPEFSCRGVLLGSGRAFCEDKTLEGRE